MKFPEKYRAVSPFHNTAMAIFSHCFKIPFEGRELVVIASDWGKWQHVSVSLSNRCPNWREMCFIKDLFWEEEEECIQFHPKKSEYVDMFPYCLHIWKPPAEASALLSNRVIDCEDWLKDIKK